MDDREAQEMRVQERFSYKSCRVETGPGVVEGESGQAAGHPRQSPGCSRSQF